MKRYTRAIPGFTSRTLFHGTTLNICLRGKVHRAPQLSSKRVDYHDFVFRDGKLVGEFEQMYREVEEIPWHQDEQTDWVDVRLSIELLREFAPFSEVHDLGCGLGYYLSLLHERLGNSSCKAYGYDISSTACEKARAIFPDFVFRQMDLTAAPSAAPQEAASATDAKRLFAIRGTLWYVFPHISNVVDTIANRMTGSDHLLVVQNFPPPHTTFVGKEVIPDPAALVRHFSSHFRPVRTVWYEDTIKAANDNWFIGYFTLRR
jgi:SAM-dependent methyltransferase